MPELPRGTVTFLFTDIEGSTRLLHELGDGYAGALADHRRVLREAFARHGGVEVDTQGDAFFLAFARASDAVAAAEEAQAALAGGPIRVRMGLHTGTPELVDDGYVGLDVHFGARVASAGHGGQVLLSQATREEADIEALDLGEHRLKDFTEPVWIFQLPSEQGFPPLKTISNTNLPRPASTFVGRERERDGVVSLVRRGGRLVTLTGPGGSGKTRLALEAAGELVPEFKNGVFWVGLAPLRDPALVLDTIAQTLGAKDALAEHIAERELLLLLDNLEQVVDAATELATLVEACPNLRLLVTSRELLRVRGELEYSVPPLADPEAVELFCSRAGLPADDDVEELCRRLDNLPLAIELAAARASVLSPRQLVKRLTQRLDLLRGGRDAEARQQTLRTTIAWSYDLLDGREQEVFARLAVFEGGCTFDAAEEVAEADLDTVQSLVEKSLLRHTGERFWMLETIREYARERLEESGEAPRALRAHAAWYSQLAGLAELRSAEHTAWLERLRAEHANFREALAWLHEQEEVGDELRLASDLGEYAYHSGALHEGRLWLDRALVVSAGLPDDLRARGLAFAALTDAFEGDLDAAGPRAEEALRIARRCRPQVLGEALRALALVRSFEGRASESKALDEKALELARAHALEVLLADVSNNLGYAALRSGDLPRARALLRESIESGRRRNDGIILSVALSNMVVAELTEGRLDEATHQCAEALEVAVRHELGPALGAALVGAAALMARQGSYRDSARVQGAIEELVRRVGEPLQPLEAELQAGALEAARTHLGDDEVEAALAAGRRAEADEVAREALGWLRERSLQRI